MKVLIIGNGIAGMSAAIEAAELDDESSRPSRGCTTTSWTTA